MKTIKIIFMLLLIMPFLFVAGTIASSAAAIGPVSVGSYYIPIDNIASIGKSLKSAAEGIVLMEIDIAKNIIYHICIFIRYRKK